MSSNPPSASATSSPTPHSKWKNLSDATSLASLGNKGSLLFLPIPEESIENLAITRFDFASGSLRRGNIARYIAEVRNFGKLPSPANTTVSLLANDQPIEQHVVTLQGGETQAVPFFYRCDAPGDIKLTARLSQDPMPIDNERTTSSPTSAKRCAFSAWMATLPRAPSVTSPTPWLPAEPRLTSRCG